MNATPSVKDVDLVQVDTTALILSCVEPVANLASTYCRISPLVDREEFMQIGMLRVCELAPSIGLGASSHEHLRFAASEAMLDELERLILYSTTAESLEAFLSSHPTDPFVVDPFSDQVLPLVDGDCEVSGGKENDIWSLIAEFDVVPSCMKCFADSGEVLG